MGIQSVKGQKSGSISGGRQEHRTAGRPRSPRRNRIFTKIRPDQRFGAKRAAFFLACFFPSVSFLAHPARQPALSASLFFFFSYKAPSENYDDALPLCIFRGTNCGAEWRREWRNVGNIRHLYPYGHSEQRAAASIFAVLRRLRLRFSLASRHKAGRWWMRAFGHQAQYHAAGSRNSLLIISAAFFGDADDVDATTELP